MFRRPIQVGILILIFAGVGLWLKAYRGLPSEPDKVSLRNGDVIEGKIVKQEFGKYVVVDKLDDKRQIIVWEQIRDIDLFNPPWYLRIDEALDAVLKLGVIGGFIIFGVGLWQYKETQKWKRAEFLIKEIGEFEGDEDVANARTMLDFNGRDIFLHGDDKSAVFVDNALLTSALRSPTRSVEFNSTEQAIRDVFDVYLSNLDRFNNFLEAGLVKKKELKLYLEYWMNIIGNPKNAKLELNARQRLWGYMRENDFRGAVQLLKRYGYPTKAAQPPERVSTNHLHDSIINGTKVEQPQVPGEPSAEINSVNDSADVK